MTASEYIRNRSNEELALLVAQMTQIRNSHDRTVEQFNEACTYLRMVEDEQLARAKQHLEMLQNLDAE